MSTVGELKVKIGADLKDFERKMSDAQKKIQQTGKSMMSMGKNLSVGLTAPIVGATAAAAALSIKVGNMADRLLDLETITGLSTDALQEWDFIAGQAGVSSDVVQTSIRGLATQLKMAEQGSGTALKGFEKLNIGLKNTDGSMRDSGQVFEEAISKLAQMDNQTERNVAANEIFGRGWMDLAPILSQGAEGIEQLRQEAHDLGVVLDKDALEGANSFRIALDKLRAQFDGMLNQLGAKLAPMMEEVFLPIIQDMILPAINKLADFVGRLAERFKNLAPQTQKIILIVTGLLAALGPVIAAMGFFASTILPMLTAGLAALFSPITLIVAAVAGAAILIITYWEEIVDYFTVGPGAKVWLPVQEALEILWHRIKQVFGLIFDHVTWVWSTLMNIFTSEGESSLQFISDAFDKYLGQVGLVFSAFANLLKGDWKALWNDIKGLFVGFVDFFTGIYAGFIGLILEGVGKIVGLFNDDWGDALSNAADSVRDFQKDLIDLTATAIGYEEVVRETAKSTDEFSKKTKDAKDESKKLERQTLDTTKSLEGQAEATRELATEMVKMSAISGAGEVSGGTEAQGMQGADAEVADLSIGSVGEDMDAIAFTVGGVFKNIGKALAKATHQVISGIGHTFISEMEGFSASIQSVFRGDIVGMMINSFQEISQASEEFQSFMGEMSEGIMESLEPVIDQFNTFLPVMQPLLDVFAQLAATIGGVLITVLDAIVPPLTMLLEMVVMLLEPLSVLIELIVDMVGAVLEAVVEAMRPLIPVLRTIFEALSSVIAPVGEIVAIAAQLLIPIMRIVASVLQIVAPLLELVGWILETLVVPILTVLVDILDFLISAIASAAEFIAKIFGGSDEKAETTDTERGIGATRRDEIMASGAIQTDDDLAHTTFNSGGSPASNVNMAGINPGGGGTMQVQGHITGRGDDLLMIVERAKRNKGIVS